jgi:ABC-2 type transport system ATP-binding protein
MLFDGRHIAFARFEHRLRRMQPIIAVSRLSKKYDSGFEALKGIDLEIARGEIFALLGPNGAGKTTLISSDGAVTVGGHDIVRDYRAARSMIGLVPQELTTDQFESVFDTVSFTRGLFGKAPNPTYIEKILKDLSLYDKRDNKLRELSGGMKRRVLIAKALSHEPDILFLDEPTAGVDVSLRKDMWEVIRKLRESGVTIILTTHYIEEAEEMADRIGIISQGRLLLVERKAELMRKLGVKQLKLEVREPLASVPESLATYDLELNDEGRTLVSTFDRQGERTRITALLADLQQAGIRVRDLDTHQSSLEDIFVSLVKEQQ